MTRQPAFTLVEMLVVAGIIAIILGIAIASLRALTGGVQVGNARTMLRTVLASARAEAAARGHVVGVRFEQYVYPPLYSVAAGVRPARQAEDGATLAVTLYPASTDNYATYAIAQLRTVVVGAQPTWADAFDYWASCCYVAAPGREPTRFPQGVEFAWGLYANPNAAQEALNNAALTTNLRLSTTFTVLFSPSGQVLIRPAFVIKRHNRDSVFYSPDYPTPSSNTDPNLDPRPADVVPLLLPDDLVGLTLTTNPATWVTGKSSQNYLWLYDQTARKQAGATPWTSYLSLHQKEARILINPYTGQLQEPSGP